MPGTFWFVFGLRDGKVVTMDMYADKAQALEAAGLQERSFGRNGSRASGAKRRCYCVDSSTDEPWIGGRVAPWRCTILHSPSSRRYTWVERTVIGSTVRLSIEPLKRS